VSFDLVVWRSDRPVSPAEARATARALVEGGDAGVRPAEELAVFAREVERRFGDNGLLRRLASPRCPVELEAWDDHALLSIAWSCVEEAAGYAHELAERLGLVLFDPQSGRVYLPPSLGSSPPPDWSAAASRGREVIDKVTGVLAGRPVGQDPDAVMAGLADELRGQFPGIEISRVDERPVVDPVFDGVPSGFVLPSPAPDPGSRRALERLLNGLARGDRYRRRASALELGGWPATAEIIAALRACLSEPDVYLRGQAAMCLGILGDADSVGRILEVTESRWEGEPGIPKDLGIEDEPAVNAAYGATALALARPDVGARAHEALTRLRDRTSGRNRERTESLLARLGRAQ
jgi:hypothetical protein